MGDAVNILLLPDLSLSAGLEVALLAIRWDAVLRGGTFNFFVVTILLMG